MKSKGKMKAQAQRVQRKDIVLSIAQEYSGKVELAPRNKIVVFIHSKWRLPLEDRIRTHGWRYSKITNWGEFCILTLVDSYR